jgi:chromosome partitioning protein
MAQVVAFINMKGGVGKTTLAVNVAYALAWFHGKKVLLVDVDPQFNATQYLLEDQTYLNHLNDKKGTIQDIFQPRRPGAVSTVRGISKGANNSKMSLSACTCRIAARSNGFLDLIPSTLQLIELEMAARGTENKLKKFISENASHYDYVIIDCPPTVSIYTQAAILASDKYLVPIKPDPLSVMGLPLLERWLEDFSDSHGMEPESVGLVFTLVRNPLPNVMRDTMESLRLGREDTVFRTHLSMSKDVAESVESHQPVFHSAEASKASQEVVAITREFLDRT